MQENLTVLVVQIKSANWELERIKVEQELASLANNRSRVCNNCHFTGHTKKTCKSQPCQSVKNYKIKEKHPECKTQISLLQAELKGLIKQHEKQKNELDNFLASRQKSSSFFFQCYAAAFEVAEFTEIHRSAET